MHELVEEIPDAEVLLALEPEELAGVILRLVQQRTRLNSPQICPGNCILELRKDPYSRGSGYPDDRVRDIQVAVAEAFAWLEAQALIITDPHGSGTSWKILSRRAQRMETKEDFRQFHLARLLNRGLLHSAIAEKVWLAFVRGNFAEGVFASMRAVEISVREAAGFAEGDHGVAMIRRAFHKDTGTLRNPAQDEGKRDALMHLFAGAVGSYKNPHSHRNVALDDAGEAIEIVMLASHLLRIVDSRSEMRSVTSEKA